MKDISEVRILPKAFQREETKIDKDMVIKDFKCCD
jgi:hypothetical protein